MGFIFLRGNFRVEDKLAKMRKLPLEKLST